MKKQKKSMLITIVAILTLLVIVGGATYAYFTAQMGGGNTSPVTVTTNTTDSLTFIEGTAINLYVETADFGQGAGNKVGTTTTKANLIANNYTNTATANYNVFFIIDGNTFEYTTDDQKAELIMSVTDPNGNEVTSIDGLEYVTSGGVSGFDITARANNQNLTGSFLIASDYEISASLADGATGPAQTEQSWTVTVTLVNLDSDQNANTGKSFSARVVITKDEETTYEIAQINSATTTTTATTATITLDDITPGTYDLEKYFFGVEEVNETTAMVNNILRLGNNLLAAEEDATWYESSSPTYTFTNLKDDTAYIFYIYALDKNGIKTATYATSEIKTLVYTLANVNATATSDKTSITITATGTAGSGTIEKYYYTVDYKTDGTTEWLPAEGTIDTTYTATRLVANTTYNVAVKAIDSNGRETNPYVLEVKTLLFDIGSIFAMDIVSLHTEDGDNDLYYHDGVGTYATLEAGDNSYRYTGADPINYVCFGSDATSCPTENLYRIIGVFDNRVKLISSEYATSDVLGNSYDFAFTFENNTYNWTKDTFSTYKGTIDLSNVGLFYWNYSSGTNSTNNWSESQLNKKNLNEVFINYINNSDTKWENMIDDNDWQVGGITHYDAYGSANAKSVYDIEVGSNVTASTYTDRVALMYISDYMYAADAKHWSKPLGTDSVYPNSEGNYGETYDYRSTSNDNWLYKGTYEWTITRETDSSYWKYAFRIDINGSVHGKGSQVSEGRTVRPVFYLNSSVTYTGGTGTSSDPYRID